MAFEPGQAQQRPQLVDIGKEIVKKCANVPLAIRTLGSFLYGKDERKWLLFKDTSLANIPESQNNILSILNLSYQQLWSPLKNCFAYCSLFPKGYQFEVEQLKDLWMAEGFIVPTSRSFERQSLEELAEEYFFALLQRCFFQDVEKDEWGAITSCKMHDLMHDLAQEVAGDKCKVAQLEDRNFVDKIHHLSLAYRLTSSQSIPSCMLDLKLLRTLLLPQQLVDGSIFNQSLCQQLISSFGCLRVLDLHELGVKSLPDSIGQLVHLRYLDLSKTPIVELPSSIMKLHNLLTLKLFGCRGLTRLPTHIRKLVNLRCLDVDQCWSLQYMPSGLGELTSLHKLSLFSITEHSSQAALLSELKNLNNLMGKLTIFIKGNSENRDLQANDANLISKSRLTQLTVEMDFDDKLDHESVLEGLQPNRNLRVLKIFAYEAQELPSWARMDSLYVTLPNLIEIELFQCTNEQLPSFGRLPFLKRLSLKQMDEVEYMEMVSNEQDVPSSSELPLTETLFFPSLEELILENMDKLKGFWKQVSAMDDENTEEQLVQPRPFSMSFSKLSKLSIEYCPRLVILPLCPNLEELSLLRSNEIISVSKMATTSSELSSTSGSSHLKLKKLRIGNVEDLISLPEESLHQLSSLDITLDKKLVSTDKLGKFFKTSHLSSSLKSLQLFLCENLRSISKGLEPLTALEKLSISSCRLLNLSSNHQQGEDDNIDMPWKAFENSLRSLTLGSMKNLVILPSGLQHLTALRSLVLSGNAELMQLPEWIAHFPSLGSLTLFDSPKITSLPEGFRKLTTLHTLVIRNCPELKRRCQAPNGSEWPKIQRISFVSFSYDEL